MVSYQVEQLRPISEELRELGAELWEKIKYEPLDTLEVSQDDEALFLLEDSNMLRTITARTEEGELVGYTMFMCSPLTHHSQHTCATEIGFYVKESHSSEGIGSKLIDETERVCTEAGVEFLVFTVPHTFDYSALLTRKQFVSTEQTYMKRIN